MKNRDLIRDAMMFAVKDITGRVLREATVQSMIDDFEKQLTLTDVVDSEERTELHASSIPEFGTDEWIDCCEQLFGGIRKSR